MVDDASKGALAERTNYGLRLTCSDQVFEKELICMYTVLNGVCNGSVSYGCSLNRVLVSVLSPALDAPQYARYLKKMQLYPPH